MFVTPLDRSSLSCWGGVLCYEFQGRRIGNTIYFPVRTVGCANPLPCEWANGVTVFDSFKFHFNASTSFSQDSILQSNVKTRSIIVRFSDSCRYSVNINTNFIKVNRITNCACIHRIAVRERVKDEIRIARDNGLFKGVGDVRGTGCVVRKGQEEIL